MKTIVLNYLNNLKYKKILKTKSKINSLILQTVKIKIALSKIKFDIQYSNEIFTWYKYYEIKLDELQVHLS